MREFFYGWRRKVGCILLVMALVFVLGWIRSCLVWDAILGVVGSRYHFLISRNGSISWMAFTYDHPYPLQWRVAEPSVSAELELDAYYEERRTNRPGFAEWTTTYPVCAIPLTLLSAYLILWPGKRPERPTKPPPEKSATQ